MNNRHSFSSDPVKKRIHNRKECIAALEARIKRIDEGTEKEDGIMNKSSLLRMVRTFRKKVKNDEKVLKRLQSSQ
ncbi:hypothetical protein COB64_04420 [Candidatus Wolfebacteria bacterium]|nr:MAG: hypothetical protein COB64_04420 [Candidatus Wolfebacteria bacterium]